MLTEREERLGRLSENRPVTKRFPLLVEYRVDEALSDGLGRAVEAYILASLRCFNPEKKYLPGEGLLENYGPDILALPNRTPNGKLAAKKEVAPEFNLVQQAAESIFTGLGLGGFVERIQLPVIVRIQDGRPDEKTDSRPYATSKMHSDIWTGEPADSATVILPVLGDVARTGVEFFGPVLSSVEEFARTYRDYLDTRQFVDTAERYDCLLRKSHLYIFDSFCLHRTLKQNGGIRVSVDFRIIFRDKVTSDIQRDASRILAYAPQEKWYTAKNKVFLMPADTAEDTLAKFRAGAAAPAQAEEFATASRNEFFPAPPSSGDPLSEKDVRFYRENGYCLLEGLLSARECEEYLREAENLSRQQPVLHAPIINPDRQEKLFRRLLCHPDAVRCLEILQDWKISALQSLIYFKPPGSMGRDYHQDNFYARAMWGAFIGIWIALEDADPENGGLIVFPGSHREGILEIIEDPSRKQTNAGDFKNERGMACRIPAEYVRTDVPVKAGSAVFIHGNLAHGSENNISKDRFRRAFAGHYIKKGFPFIPGTHAKRQVIDVYQKL